MAEIGEIQKGIDIGYKSPTKHIYHACNVCGKERWVMLVKGKPVSDKCNSCCQFKENNPHWSGGRFARLRDGYIYVFLGFNNPYSDMVDKGGYIAEHRLVMAQAIERSLTENEIVHHINGIKDDNRFDNLELQKRSTHMKLYEELLKEIRLLKWQVKELQKQVSREGIKDG